MSEPFIRQWQYDEDWRKVVRSPELCDFLSALATGATLEEAYCLARNVESCRPIDARRMYADAERAHPAIVKGIREKRMGMMDVIAEDRVLGLLDSEREKSRDAGVRHARAMRGMDAPTKVELSNPHLDESKITGVNPGGKSVLERLRERLSGGQQ